MIANRYEAYEEYITLMTITGAEVISYNNEQGNNEDNDIVTDENFGNLLTRNEYHVSLIQLTRMKILVLIYS